jgi:hypothetical protein
MGKSISIQTGLQVEWGRKSTPEERELGEWAAKRGLFLLLGTYTEDDGSVTPTADLGVEEYVKNKIICFFLALPTHRPIWPEALDHYEKLIRAGLEREKEKHCAYAWWENLSR